MEKKQEKVFVITISDVYDYEGYPHAPIICRSKESAMKQLRELRDEVKSQLEENGDGDWLEDEFNENSTCFSMYPDGYWGTSHYDARIDEVKVED